MGKVKEMYLNNTPWDEVDFDDYTFEIDYEVKQLNEGK